MYTEIASRGDHAIQSHAIFSQWPSAEPDLLGGRVLHKSLTKLKCSTALAWDEMHSALENWVKGSTKTTVCISEHRASYRINQGLFEAINLGNWPVVQLYSPSGAGWALQWSQWSLTTEKQKHGRKTALPGASSVSHPSPRCTTCVLSAPPPSFPRPDVLPQGKLDLGEKDFFYVYLLFN